ncbi:winged helix-turn-helix transcriptional regulator [Streptosporangium amethystogenes]|uniref:winged helix-turn-helix transcriptional regulator n=1 Tax=Streptosporangium amethystogenes TaxID=2002 RepID=UPI00069141E7|nr:helix-turn-helix domain-containing protein [Streptosporangium amethystogenes]
MDGAEREPVRAELGAIGQALAILGDRWVLLILQRAFLLRIRTFAGWRDALGISESVLAARLRELVDHGIFELSAYRNGRTRYEYRLTERGLRLWALLVAIHAWERDWVSQGHFPPLLHELCGQDAEPRLGCGVCLEPMSARDTRTEPGPQVAFSRIGPPRRHRRTVRSGTPADLIGYCPASMEILGDRWSTSVLAGAFLGTCRFVDFQSGLGIAPSVLTDRLRRFVELGVFDPRPDGSYRLTDRGLAFFEVFALLVDWAQRELPASEGSALSITHLRCGAAFRPVLLCRACGRPLERREVRFLLPG